jgi:hypothetical protein
MTSWRWAVAGLVAAALLFGVGWWLGHRGATLRDPERRALVAANDTLKARHAKQVKVLAAQAAASQDSARRMADRARRAEAGRVAADATADSLAGVTGSLDAKLADATTLADSVPILIAQRDAVIGERDHAKQQVEGERAIAANWRSSYEKQLEASAKLQARIDVDSTRIIELDATVEDLSKPGRLAFDLLGFRTQCGPGVAYSIAGHAQPALACVAKL